MSSNVNQDTYIVTGATGGIGKALVKELVNRNVARVILACRNTALASQLIADYNGADTKLLTIHLDLESFDSVIAFADEVKSRGYMVKALLNNAGTMPGEVRITSDGYESATQTNFLSTMLLTELLLPTLRDGSAIVFTTSMTRRIAAFHENWDVLSKRHHNRFVTYGRSKKMLTAYAALLSDRLRNKGNRVNCSDPWIVDSGIINMGNRIIDNLSSRLFRPLIYTPAQGASSAIAAMDSELTGTIFSLRKTDAISAKYKTRKVRDIIESAFSAIKPI